MTNVGKNSKLKSKNSKGLQIFEFCLLTFEFKKMPSRRFGTASTIACHMKFF